MSAEIVLVTGLGRCGTSLVMQMLAAGGMSCVGNWPDYETHLSTVPAPQEFITASSGRAVKVLDPHRVNLPTGPVYRAIWLTRDPDQQAKSMLKLIGQPENRKSVRALSQSIRKDTRLARGALHKRGADVLHLTFEGILMHPLDAALQLADHINRQMHLAAMVGAIRRRDARCLPTLMEAEMIP